MSTLRSGYAINGQRMFCDERPDGKFQVASRYQRFHKTADLDEALVVFEGLCLEEAPTREHAQRLVLEARRNRRSRFTSLAAWERRVLECARRRAEGLVPRIMGSKGSVEAWLPQG